MRTRAKMCLQILQSGCCARFLKKLLCRQGRFGAKFAKRQFFFDTQFFLFRIQKVIFGIHTAVRQGLNVGFCQSKCSVVLSFGVFSSTSQVGQIDHCQRPVKHTNCLPVTFTRAKLVRPWKLPCRKSMGLVSWQCKDLFWYKPWSREIPDCLQEIFTWLPLHSATVTTDYMQTSGASAFTMPIKLSHRQETAARKLKSGIYAHQWCNTHMVCSHCTVLGHTHTHAHTYTHTHTPDGYNFFQLQLCTCQ